MKNYILVALCFVLNSATIFAQQTINDFKYIVIPAQFDFLSEPDKYQLNSLSKFLFNKYGYTAFLETDNLPDDLKMNRCKAMKLQVTNEKGGLFKTKIQMNLLDCNGNLITQSQVGETREKVLSNAYKLALRDAFETFRFMDYNYVAEEESSEKMEPIENSIGTDQNYSVTPRPEVEALDEVSKVSSVNKESAEKKIDTPSVVVSSRSEIEEVRTVGNSDSNSVNTGIETLYAQPIENGFQLVNTEPKKVMVLLNTGKEDVYLVKGKDAIVYFEDGFWYYSENGGTLNIQSIDIKF